MIKGSQIYAGFGRWLSIYKTKLKQLIGRVYSLGATSPCLTSSLIYRHRVTRADTTRNYVQSSDSHYTLRIVVTLG